MTNCNVCNKSFSNDQKFIKHCNTKTHKLKFSILGNDSHYNIRKYYWGKKFISIQVPKYISTNHHQNPDIQQLLSDNVDEIELVNIISDFATEVIDYKQIYNQFTVKKLQQICKYFNLAQKGKKTIIINRLLSRDIYLSFEQISTLIEIASIVHYTYDYNTSTLNPVSENIQRFRYLIYSLNNQ